MDFVDLDDDDDDDDDDDNDDPHPRYEKTPPWLMNQCKPPYMHHGF